MPRLSPRLIYSAKAEHPLLPLVLNATRELQAARNELRWLQESAIGSVQEPLVLRRRTGWRHKLKDLCRQRSRGKPLQYLLGSEFFGDLEIICAPGVLIPRQETAASVTYLVDRLVADAKTHLPQSLRVLDLCTGTGCIPLLFHNEFYKRTKKNNFRVELAGIDISARAIALAGRNLARVKRESDLAASNARDALSATRFIRADVLARTNPTSQHGVTHVLDALQEVEAYNGRQTWDVIISNPPYISPAAFNKTTTRSVRTFEPKLALVPDAGIAPLGMDRGDAFYPRLLELARLVDAKIILFEVADLEQAQRVAAMTRKQGVWSGIEIWRDQPGGASDDENRSVGHERIANVPIRGRGNGRSVFAWRGAAERWLMVDPIDLSSSL